MSGVLDALCLEAGVIWQFKDGAGNLRSAPVETRKAILSAMGIPADNDAVAASSLKELAASRQQRAASAWIVSDASDPVTIAMDGKHAWRLRLETGELREGTCSGSIVFGRLPVGYHTLTIDNLATTILNAPRKLPLPKRGWGIMVPLYGLKSGSLGDYADLAETARIIGVQGASFIGINPVHAGFSEDPDAYSPYSPSSRRRFNIAHIATGEAPSGGAGLIDYRRATSARYETLRKQFANQGDDPDLDDFIAREGLGLRDFAVHQALSAQFGPYWNQWPEPYKRSDTAAVEKFASENSLELRFHSWLQMMAERQLRHAAVTAGEAGMHHGLYLDLAVGTHPHGAETWADRSLYAENISLGAPPDAFSPTGQTWGLAPMIPHRLEQSGFMPLAETLRKQLAFAGILRIDHILGFDRAFWVPDKMPGAYVTMPKQAMLAVARIEAHRAGGTIIGEDLGNVPDGLRADLKQSGILGCKVAMFERNWKSDHSFRRAETYEPRSIASFNTHDLPTWSGWRKGQDIVWRQTVKQVTASEATSELAARSSDVAEFDAVLDGNGLDDLCRFLGRTGSRLVALQIEDILGLDDQPNLPGTVSEHPNWRRQLPVKLSALSGNEQLIRVKKIMADTNR